MTAHATANENVTERSADYNAHTCQEDISPHYRFDFDVKNGEDLSITDKSLKIRGYAREVDLQLKSLYPDME